MFVIVMEAFRCMVSKALLAGLLSGFSVGCPGRGLLVVSHLLFANDTLVFCEADEGQLFHL